MQDKALPVQCLSWFDTVIPELYTLYKMIKVYLSCIAGLSHYRKLFIVLTQKRRHKIQMTKDGSINKPGRPVCCHFYWHYKKLPLQFNLIPSLCIFHHNVQSISYCQLVAITQVNLSYLAWSSLTASTSYMASMPPFSWNKVWACLRLFSKSSNG